jgi:lipopolysaccharide/colanic/teichoic acid biosynthesis glycosyltransferase
MSAWLRVRVVLDRLVACVGLVIVAPIVGLLALLIRREDDGPALIELTRVGRDRRPFAMKKLRSMRDASNDGASDGAPLTSPGDPRITRVGQPIRKLHLDELPQLLNVIRGEMALIGPRPETPDFVDDSVAWTRALAMPPGILGLTQLVVNEWERSVIGDDPEGGHYAAQVLPVKLAIDGWYVAHATPLTDLLVMWFTVLHVVLRSPPRWLTRHISRHVPEVESELPRLQRSSTPAHQSTQARKRA